LLLKHKRTKLQIWCISQGQIAFSPVFDLYHYQVRHTPFPWQNRTSVL